MTGPADETVRLRMELGDEVSGPARRGEESLRAEGEQARRTARDVTELEHATNSLARSQRELALANEMEAASARGSARERLSASRAVRSAEASVVRDTGRVRAAEEDVERRRRLHEQNERGRHRSARQRFSEMGSWLKKVGKIWDTHISKLHLVGKAMGVLKIAAMAGAIVELGAAGVAAVAGLTPLIGVFAALPGIMLVAGQAMGVFKAATSGMGQTIKDLSASRPNYAAIQTDLQNLAPAAQQAALYLGDLNNQVLKPMQQTMQQNFFAKLNPGLNQFTSLITFVRPVLEKTATVLGGIALQFAKLAGSPMFKSDVFKILQGGNVIIGTMGKGFVSLVSASARFFVLLLPFMKWMAAGFAAGSKHIDKWVHSVHGAKAISGFFNSTKHVMQMTWAVLKNFVIGFVQLGKGATGMSSAMGKGLVSISKKFRDWTASASGKNKIRAFFAGATVAMHDFGKILGGVAHLFASFGNSPGLKSSVGIIHDKFVPAIVGFLNNGSGSKFASAIGDAAKAFFQLLASLRAAGVIGVTFLAVKALTWIMRGMAWVLNHLPGPIARTVGTLVTLALIVGKINWLFKVGRLLMLLYKGAVIAFRLAMIGLRLAIILVNGSIAVMDALMTANPVGALVMIIVAAIVALVVIIYMLIKHWRGVWTGIKTVALFVWNSFLKPMFVNLAKIFSWVFNHIIKPIAKTFMDDWGKVARFFTGVFGGLVKGFKWVGDKFQWIYDHTIGRIVNLVKDAWGWLTGGKTDNKVVARQGGTTGGQSPGVDAPNGAVGAGMNQFIPPNPKVPGGTNPAPKSRATGPGNSTVPGKWSGGIVTPLHDYLVGEKGPELFKGPKGFELLGASGPVLVNFSAPGIVIPNRQFENKYGGELPRAKMPSLPYKGPTSDVPRSKQPSREHTVIDGRPVNVTVMTRDFADFENRVRGVFDRMRREERERAIRWRGDR